jgi:anthranilate phosphoribosyltransferase
MHDLTARLREGADLPEEDVLQAVSSLVSPEVDEAAKGDFLKALRAKGETAAEIAAFARALLAHAVDPEIDPARLSGPMLDVCGTGGDKMDLFNVSTTSMFVLAAGGAVVVKHGNRAITSQCGGADVLEELGVRIDLPPDRLSRCVEEVGLGFVFAPAYHPAFKAIVPVRKQLAAEGIPTIFNILGPLLNPARPPYQLVGIFDAMKLPIYGEVLSGLGRTRAWALNSSGADEILPFGSTRVVEAATAATPREFSIDPGELGIEPCTHDELRGGTRQENAYILLSILDGSERGAKREVVALNAAAGFVVTGLVPDLPAGLAYAREQIDSGHALSKLRDLQLFA